MLTTPRDLEHVLRALDNAKIPHMFAHEGYDGVSVTLPFGYHLRVDVDGWHINGRAGSSEALALVQLGAQLQPFTPQLEVVTGGIALEHRSAPTATCFAAARLRQEPVTIRRIGCAVEQLRQRERAP